MEGIIAFNAAAVAAFASTSISPTAPRLSAALNAAAVGPTASRLAAVHFLI